MRLGIGRDRDHKRYKVADYPNPQPERSSPSKETESAFSPRGSNLTFPLRRPPFAALLEPLQSQYQSH